MLLCSHFVFCAGWRWCSLRQLTLRQEHQPSTGKLVWQMIAVMLNERMVLTRPQDSFRPCAPPAFVLATGFRSSNEVMLRQVWLCVIHVFWSVLAGLGWRWSWSWRRHLQHRESFLLVSRSLHRSLWFLRLGQQTKKKKRGQLRNATSNVTDWEFDYVISLLGLTKWE